MLVVRPVISRFDLRGKKGGRGGKKIAGNGDSRVFGKEEVTRYPSNRLSGEGGGGRKEEKHVPRLTP